MGCSSSKEAMNGPEPEMATKIQGNESSKATVGVVKDVPVAAGSTATSTATAKMNTVPSLPPPILDGRLPPNTKIIFVLGGPGSGKGTQCSRIVAKYKLTHLSAGDLLRAEVKAGSETGQQLETYMKEGKLVPQEVTIALLKKAMLASGSSSFLIDGFPRALDQAQTFEQQIQPCDMVLFFDCPAETMQERLTERGKTSGRSDDNAETIAKRFKTFTDESMPVVQKYSSQGKAYTISAVPPPDSVFTEVEKILEPVFGHSRSSVVPSIADVTVPASEVKAGPVKLYNKAPSANWSNDVAQSQKTSSMMGLMNPAQGKLSPSTHILWVLGGPGSGMGTQCSMIKSKYGYTHLSVGDVMREEVKSGSQLGLTLDDSMKDGTLVPTEVTIALLKNAMLKSRSNMFLVDGFPRALDQAETFERDIMPCQTVLYFDCPEKTMEERLTERAKTGGRNDDSPEVLRKRFNTFTQSSLPVVQHYESKGKLHKINAVGEPNEVFAQVEKVLDMIRNEDMYSMFY